MAGERSKSKSYANVAPLPSSDNGRNPSRVSTPLRPVSKSSDQPADGLNELRSKLEIQREINKELKRLLIASVGEELHTRFDRLVSERASLSYELGKSVQQLTEGNEELECLSIQCDVWRSKFTASRLMIDELSQWKETVFDEHKCQQVICKLLEEHQQLYQQLKIINSHLKQLSTITASHKLSELRPHVIVRPVQMPIENHTLLELADENLHLSSDLAENVPTLHDHPVMRSLTQGEQLATQLLHSKDRKVQHHLMDQRSTVSLSSTIRAFLSSRQDHTDVRFKCSRCRGQIFVV